LKLVFIGTSAFARPSLERLARAHDISLVVTQPDRPAGRGGRLRTPPVKQSAHDLGLQIVQPENVNAEDAVDRIRASFPEVIVVAAYGQILKQSVFTLAPHGAINIHASLLPAFRGAAPVHWAIIRGGETTGVTTFLIDRGMDTGALLCQETLPIGPDETGGELEERLADLGAAVILRTLEALAAGALLPKPQPDEGISLAPRLTRDDARIDWEKRAATIHNLVRGTNPWPGAWTMLGKERIKVHRSVRTGILKGSVRSGGIPLAETGRLLVGCGDELIELLELQREGRPRVDGRSFLNGLRGDRHFG
jgi:methionyl-tRNA formyltransferase